MEHAASGSLSHNVFTRWRSSLLILAYTVVPAAALMFCRSTRTPICDTVAGWQQQFTRHASVQTAGAFSDPRHEDNLRLDFLCLLETDIGAVVSKSRQLRRSPHRPQCAIACSITKLIFSQDKTKHNQNSTCIFCKLAQQRICFTDLRVHGM